MPNERQKQADSLYLQKLLTRVNAVDMHVTCCLECHFSYEKKNVFPYLPQEIREALELEHVALLKSKDVNAIVEHSQREMTYFYAYCPVDVIERVEADHLKYYLEHDIPVHVGEIMLGSPIT